MIENSSQALAELLGDSEQLRERINCFRSKSATVPLSYRNHIQAAIETDEEAAACIKQRFKSARISAFNADLAYRIRYSSVFTKIMPVYIAPKETADRILKSIKQQTAHKLHSGRWQ